MLVLEVVAVQAAEPRHRTRPELITDLTSRECDVLHGVARGRSDAEITGAR